MSAAIGLADPFDFGPENFTDVATPPETYAGISIYFFSSICAVVANIVMLVLIYKKGRQRTTFDLTVSSLSLANLITSFALIINTTLFTMSLKDSAFLTGKLGEAFKILGNFGMYCTVSSIFHILSITMERLYGVLRPFHYRQIATKRRIIFIICLMWALSAAIFAVDHVVWNNGMKGSVLAVMIFSAGGLLCVMYTIIIVKAYLRQKQQLSATPSKELLVIKNSVAVTLCFICCTFPLGLAELGFSIEIADKYGYLFSSFVAVKLFMEPLLYFFINYWRERKAKKRRYWMNSTMCTVRMRRDFPSASSKDDSEATRDNKGFEMDEVSQTENVAEKQSQLQAPKDEKEEIEETLQILENSFSTENNNEYFKRLNFPANPVSEVFGMEAIVENSSEDASEEGSFVAEAEIRFSEDESENFSETHESSLEKENDGSNPEDTENSSVDNFELKDIKAEVKGKNDFPDESLIFTNIAVGNPL